MKTWTALLVAIALLALVLSGWPTRSTPPEQAPSLSLKGLLNPDATDVPTLDETWSLNLPADHGPHLESPSELWNLSLWLADEQGQAHWLQINLGRLALSAKPLTRPSAWAAHQIYRGHWVSLSSGEMAPRTAERLRRAALDLAGSSTNPARVWLDDWSLESRSDPNRLQLTARHGANRLALALTADKPALDGEQLRLFTGNPEGPGLRAYLLTRLRASGSLSLDGRLLRVRGSAWLDHAWGGIGNTGDQLALNRFALQLADGRDLLCLELQRQERGGRPIPSCALILADGTVQSFQRRELELRALEHWTSPRTGHTYPLGWRLAIPLLDLELGVHPMIEDQETDLAIPHWNGVVRVDGQQGGQGLSGVGRVELALQAPLP